MFTRHVDQSLTRYYDGELPAVERQRVEAHLASCERCRAALDEIQFSATLVRQLTAVSAPPSVWHGIDAALAGPHRTFAARLPLRWAAACAVLLVIAGSAYWWTRDFVVGPWEVAQTKDGISRRMTSGEWVETDDGSEARITVGALGTVDVAPGTRVRLGEVSESEYRLALARGTISAEIVAPPRLFIVDTPASTVVDLGCAYTVTVGEDGAGQLRMTSGWAALEFKGRESLVPAGAICRTRPGAGPGTPYFEDAPAALKEAVDDFDEGTRRTEALAVIIREARARDTLTLWHLLSRVGESDRVRVYDGIAAFEPPPAAATRSQILALDADALREWREELAWKW
ncbi:MAG: zf-HC2 domain-containing protein [Vicinamibacterales bacterium]